MIEEACEIGIVGLGVMGRNLALNVAGHRYSVEGFDTDPGKVRDLRAEATAHRIKATGSIEDLVASLRRPRAVMTLVPAGPPVDAVIADLLPHLERGDLIMDGGNSHFRDTERRQKSLEDRGIDFLGVGISGGGEGALHGPSIMPGGPRSGYERVRPVLEAIAARVDGQPCVTYLGPGSAGHYVKMVHNGIEYALMQLIAESYDLMKRGLGLANGEMRDIYDGWNRAELGSYLVEITSRIFSRVDEKTNGPLIDLIEDQASQKGTGMWTSQDAMELQVPVPTIDAAVSMRNMSARKDERVVASRLFDRPVTPLRDDREGLLAQLRNALFAGFVVAFAQGMDLLRTASKAYGYGLDLAEVARIWRGGCIIRAGLLEDIHAGYAGRPDLPNLLVDQRLARAIMARQDDLRRVVQTAAEQGIPALALAASLSYLDSYRSAWLPANLIQAQRDYFGAHTYRRVDEPEPVHTRWEQE